MISAKNRGEWGRESQTGARSSRVLVALRQEMPIMFKHGGKPQTTFEQRKDLISFI